MTGSIGRAAFSAVLMTGFVLAEEPKPQVQFSVVPTSLDELKKFEDKVAETVKKVMPATVGVQIGNASGSAVIVSEDGLVLTAGHVSGDPGKPARLIFPDGKVVKATTLGVAAGPDSGMMKIDPIKDEPNKKWPFVKMADPKELTRGTWVIALGHHDGYEPGRSPPVRVGRVQRTSKSTIQTDCTLVGGDSGGPLFDMDGNLVGIHSRIGFTISSNIHVPISIFKDQWDQLVSSENIGGKAKVALGIKLEEKSGKLVVADLTDADAAYKTGFRNGDRVVKIDGQEVSTLSNVDRIMRRKKPGDELSFDIARGFESKTFKLKLSKR